MIEDPFVARQRRKPPAPSAPQIPVFDQKQHDLWLQLLQIWINSSFEDRARFARLGGNQLHVEEQLELLTLISGRSGTC